MFVEQQEREQEEEEPELLQEQVPELEQDLEVEQGPEEQLQPDAKGNKMMYNVTAEVIVL